MFIQSFLLKLFLETRSLNMNRHKTPCICILQQNFRDKYPSFLSLSLFLSCSLSSILSPPLGLERAHLRVVGPAARSWILWQEFLCRASDHNLPRRTCRRCSDGNIKLPCSRYPWAAWFTDSRAPLCDPDKRAFYKGALLVALNK